jgi:hypothetical protein
MRSQKLFIAAYLAVVATSLWLRMAVPAMALGQAMHDDFLFVRLAYNLGAGQWLGPLDDVTLAKGIGYPAFILASFVAGVPLKLAEHGVYLAAAGLVTWLVMRLSGSRLLALVLFACLAFNPILWTSELARVIREGLYIGLSLALVGLAGALLLLSRESWRGHWGRIVCLIAVGAVGAAYWLTREERVWLAPAAVALIALAVTRTWLLNSGVGIRPGWLMQRVAAELAMVFAVFAALVTSVLALNYHHYDALVLSELQASSFEEAYGALNRIRHERQRYVVFPREVRQKAYAVSPAARELEPALEGKFGQAWRSNGCKSNQLEQCNEILSGWFMWALLGATAQAGHFASAREAFAYYDRLAQEINSACNDGRLSCDGRRASLLQPFEWHYLGDALAIMPRVAVLLMRLGDGAIGSPPSAGPQFAIDYMAALVGQVRSADAPAVTFSGVVAAAAIAPEVLVRDRSGAPYAATLKTAPDATGPPPIGKASIWFELETDCLRPTCELVVQSGSAMRSYRILTIIDAGVDDAGELDIKFVRIGKPAGFAGSRIASQKMRDLRLAIARPIAGAYAMLAPPLTVLAAIGLLFAILQGRSRALTNGLVVLSLVCATAVSTRIALLAYLEVNVIPGAGNLLYLSVASPFLLMFVVLGLYLGTQAAVAAYRARPEPLHRPPA